MIQEKTDMLLFRYSNFAKKSFLGELQTVIEKEGYTWMMKVGKRSSLDKIRNIKEQGGWLLLRSPKADGSKNYLTHFTDVTENIPADGVFPEYYWDIVDGIDETYLDITHTFQWFKIGKIVCLKDEDLDKIVLANSGKKLNSVIETTRTAVMFVLNNEKIDV